MPTLAEILANLSREIENPLTPGPQPVLTGFKISDTVADPMCAPFGWQTQAPDTLDIFRKGDPVGGSTDLERVLALPRRPQLDLKSDTAEAMVELEMQKYSRDNPDCRCKEIDPRRECLKRLLPAQAWMLREISLNQGLLAHMSTGGGKCHRAGTEVFDYSSSRRRMIEEPGNLSVAGFDKVLGVYNAQAFPSGSKECVRVLLADGCAAEPSTDHPYLTHRGWVKAAELHKGDFVAVAGEMPEPEHPTIASDDEVKFVAYMLSDGGVSQKSMGFTNETPAVIVDFTASAMAIGYGYNVVERSNKSRARQFAVNVGNRDLVGRWTCTAVQVCKLCNTNERGHSGRGLCHKCYQRVLLKLEPHDLNRYPKLKLTPDSVRERWSLYVLAKSKRTHADVWGLPRRQVALFLNRFWACDGHVSAHKLECTLASEKLIDDLRFLCARLGIRVRKNYKIASYVKDGIRHKFDAWRITVSGENALKFLTEVGDVLGKEVACQTLRTKLLSTTRNTNFDVVPIGNVEFDKICEELGWPKHKHGTPGPEFRRTIGSGFISRTKFLNFCEQHGYTGKYSHLATKDVAWERVVSVTPIGEHPVYDLSVPGPCNFVANGIVVHNTLVGVQAALALNNVSTVLLLIPASLRDQIQHDYQMISQHFIVPGLVMHIGKEPPIYKIGPIAGKPTLHVLPYSRLSMPEESDFLQRLQPDAIICDECDSVRSMNSSRGRRIAKYYAGGDTPEERQKRMATKFLGWTGSLTDASITDFNYLSLFALRDRSPLPLDPNTVIEWGRCLDATINPSPPGELLRFCSPGEDVRHAFRRRLAETPGFIVANVSDIAVSGGEGFVQNQITEKVAPELPPIIEEALRMVRSGVRPDSMIHQVRPDIPEVGDEDLEDAMAVARAAQEVSVGVLYFWTFPRGESVPLIKEWMKCRRAYNREVREKSMEGHTFLDSAILCEQAAQRFWGDADKREDRPEWQCYAWPEWRDIRDKVEPKTDSCVLDDFLCIDAAEWATERPGILWYRMRALATRIQQLTGLPVHDGGPKGGQRLMAERGDRSIICSIDSNGRGRDGLQLAFDRQLVVNTPASATRVEQLLGRTIRRGQRSNLVTTQLYLHTPELRKALDQAARRSEYVRDILGANQKLLDGWQGD